MLEGGNRIVGIHKKLRVTSFENKARNRNCFLFSQTEKIGENKIRETRALSCPNNLQKTPKESQNEIL